METEINNKRPEFPKRAVVTAGMPYGNKELHFGHIGGVFIPADVYARFLRDRIGQENVIFVSGTDCYGSTIELAYNELKEAGYQGDITDFVEENYEKHKDTLNKFGISSNLFAASALGKSGKVHKKMSEEVFEKLYTSGNLSLKYTKQFYDTKNKIFLNGRQVTGYCPIRGCKSEIAYANECALGHQFNESELQNPKSVLSGEKPELRSIPNWYFDLEWFRPLLEEWVVNLENRDNVRQNVISVIKEFLKEPVIYIKKDYKEEIERLKEIGKLKDCSMKSDDSKASIELAFETLSQREEACEILDNNNIRYRTGKTLVPFRISGNVKWGVPVPEKEGAKDFTFWVWPESLWAPISFTRTYLDDIGKDSKEWERYWKSKDSKVYQFIGEDNIYFYGPAEMAMFMALRDGELTSDIKDGELTLPEIVANHHIMFMGKKASSSAEVKPPKAYELLDYYTKEQLRMHFLGFALATKGVNFMPQAMFVEENGADGNINVYDPVLKEGNLLTNVFNRLIRSCFYTNQKYFGQELPEGKVSPEVINASEEIILKYENNMYKYDFNKLIENLEGYIQYGSKYWAAKSKAAENNLDMMNQVLIDCFHIVRVLTTLLHPITPDNCEMIREHLNIDERVWDWENIFQGMEFFTENNAGHTLRFLEPRVDFFAKHESQLKG